MELASLHNLHTHTKQNLITWVNGFVNLKTLTTAQLSPMNVSHKTGLVLLNGLLSRLISVATKHSSDVAKQVN